MEEGRHGDSLEVWLDRTEPPVRRLQTAATGALDVLRSPAGEDTTQALAAVGLAARQLQDWLIDHPCPEPGWNDRLSMLAAQCAFATLAARPESPAPEIRGPSATERLDRFLEQVAALIAEVGHNTEGRAEP